MGWVEKQTTIGELEQLGAILAIQDGNHGNDHPKATEYVERGIPFIMASDVCHDTINLEGAKKLPFERTEKLRVGFALPGDVLLTHKGSVGRVAIVPDVDPYIMLTPQVTYYRVNSAILDRGFLSHSFRSPQFQAQLDSDSAQSTRAYIGITAQRKLRIPFPPLPIQRRIAGILSAYDDLIEVNMRRIKGEVSDISVAETLLQLAHLKLDQGGQRDEANQYIAEGLQICDKHSSATSKLKEEFTKLQQRLASGEGAEPAKIVPSGTEAFGFDNPSGAAIPKIEKW